MSNSQSPRNSRAIQARLNGSKSQGPVTQSGKQISSKSAIKHGLFSPQVVLRNESQADFDALLTALTREHNPQSETEFQLIHQMAAATWRIHRVQRMETALLEGVMETNRAEFDSRSGDDAPDDDVEAHRIADAWRDLISDDQLDKLAQHEARFQRQFTRALKALMRLRRQQPAPAPEPVHQPEPVPAPALRPSKNGPVTPILVPRPTSSLTKNSENEPSNSNKTNRSRLDAY